MANSVGPDQAAGLKINRSKFATRKSHLPPVKNVGRKKFLPGNSVMKVISWNNKPIFNEIILQFMTKHYSIWSKGLSYQNLFGHKSDIGGK